MPEFVLAIDAGTTSVRALIFDSQWNISGRGQQSLSLTLPQPGLVEQSPVELWEHTLSVIHRSLDQAQLVAGDIAATGITSQRSCTVVWEKSTGVPLTPIISWQDLRGVQRAQELTELGFPQFPASSACKLEAAVDSIPDGRSRMRQGELCWGNVDTYLAFKLSGGTLYATDLSQACATGYLDFETEQWNKVLIETQGLDLSFFPILVDTAAVLGDTDPSILGASIPINAIVGDQQSAAIAQDCQKPGDLKITFGTSGTCNVHTGTNVVTIPGTYPLVLQRRGGRTDYCVEAMIITAGAALDWLGTTLGIQEISVDLDSFLTDTTGSESVLLLPALQGLGSPYFQPEVIAQIAGLTLSTTRKQIVYSALEGIAFRAREIIEHIEKSNDVPHLRTINIDGGLTRSETFTRILANAIYKPVSVCRHPEAAALGAARLARQADGTTSLEPLRQHSLVVKPETEMKPYYDQLYNRWKTQFQLQDLVTHRETV